MPFKWNTAIFSTGEIPVNKDTKAEISFLKSTQAVKWFVILVELYEVQGPLEYYNQGTVKKGFYAIIRVYMLI